MQTHTFIPSPRSSKCGSSFLVICDHASAVIPDEFGVDAISAEDSTRHISHDIGAAAVSTLLGEALPAHVFLANVSRLVVDLNRAVECVDVIPETSDGTVLSFNQNLSDAVRTVRLLRYHLPYHLALRDVMQTYLSHQPQHAMGILVHSFTPCLACTDQPRPWEIGLLWRDDEATAKKLKAWLEANTGYVIGDNEPYTAFSDASYTMRKHFGKAIPHIAIEIRQDLIADAAGQQKMADVLARAFTAIQTSLHERINTEINEHQV